MTDRLASRMTRPETLTAIVLILLAACFLIPTAALRPISALLPAAMLIGMIALSALLLLSDQRKAAAGEDALPMTKAPGRVMAAFLMVVAYALATDFIGFYLSTAVMIPLVAYAFGYRNLLGLALATAIVMGTIWLIFGLAMSQDFPVGRLWS